MAAVGGGVFWFFGPDDENEPEKRTVQSPAPTTSCEGNWYDTHMHSEEGLDYVDAAVQLMQEHKVGCALLLGVNANPDNLKEAKARFQDMIYPHPGRFIPLVEVDDKVLADIRRERLEKVFAALPQAKGLGESAFYQPPFRGTKLTGEVWDGVFALHHEKKAILMIHMLPEIVDEMITMLKKYPDVTIVAHGPEYFNDLPRLFELPNFYYTLDTANMLWENLSRGKNLMYPDIVKDNKQSFMAAFVAKREKLLADAVKNWVPLIEKYPTKIMWGTDVSTEWHIDKEVYAELIKLSEDFVAQLPESLRAGYMRENALKVLGEGITVQYDSTLKNYYTDLEED